MKEKIIHYKRYNVSYVYKEVSPLGYVRTKRASIDYKNEADALEKAKHHKNSFVMLVDRYYNVTTKRMATELEYRMNK